MRQARELPTQVLRTFVAIVDRGGFTQAAETLGVTQPTVSQQLKKLEQLVDRTLLVRTPRRLELTAPGQTLLDYARRILTLNDEAISSLSMPPVSGTLRLGIPHEFTLSILPRLVGAFSQIHPDVVIEVDCELSKVLLANLDNYDVVMALHKRNDAESGTRIRDEPLAWVSSLDYQFDSGKELQVVAAPDPCIYRATLEGALRAFAPGWSLRLTSTSYGAVCAAVATGMGITVLADSVVPNDLKKLDSCELPRLPRLDLRLHYPKAKATPATRTFVEFVDEKLHDA